MFPADFNNNDSYVQLSYEWYLYVILFILLKAFMNGIAKSQIMHAISVSVISIYIGHEKYAFLNNVKKNNPCVLHWIKRHFQASDIDFLRFIITICLVLFGFITYKCFMLPKPDTSSWYVVLIIFNSINVSMRLGKKLKNQNTDNFW